MKPEEQLQLAICNYLKLQFPSVIFFSDASGVRLTIGQAKKAKMMRGSRGIPDLFIAHPSSSINLYKESGEPPMYHGLFLEIKAETPYKKDGSLKSQITKKRLPNGAVIEHDHLQEQNEMLNKLNSKGYSAHFVWNFDQTKEIIDNYLLKITL
jgi:hypothetical protein